MSQHVQSESELEQIRKFSEKMKEATTPEKMDALLNEQWDKPQLAFAGYNFPYKQVGGVPEDKFVLQPHPNPDDISMLDNPFEGYSLEDVVYSQHQIILQQKKEIAELRRDLYAHNTSLNQNY